MATHLEALGHFAATLAPAAIPALVRRAARYQLVDMVAAAHAAARSAEVASVPAALDALAVRRPGGAEQAGHAREHAREDPARAGATVLATGVRRAPVEAAFENASYSMAQDFDDIVWMGHTCHSAVFAALAVAEHEGRSTAELVDAIVVANEVAGRIGASSFLGPLNGQMWTFIHLVGAAAAGARLLGLDAAQTTHALAIALAQPNFALQPGFMRPTSKLLSAATPLATGMRAAYLARAGMTGAPEILEDRRGFWRRFAYVPMPGALGELGSFWVLSTFAFKTYPVCHYFQTALEAIERLRARLGGELTLERVRRVHIATTKLACEASRFAAEYAAEGGVVTPVGACFDVAQAAAILLRTGRLGVAELDAGALAEGRDAQLAWVARIAVSHDPELTARVIAGARAIASGRAALRALTLKDGLLLVRRYRDEYGSELVRARDVWGAARGVGRGLGRRAANVARRFAPGRAHDAAGAPGRADEVAAAPDEPLGEGVPLYFPSRVTFELEDGSRPSERVDLPSGSLPAPGIERALAHKLATAAEHTLGRDGAAQAFRLALDETTPLAALVSALRART